jgi:HEPN domain-containing protein
MNEIQMIQLYLKYLLKIVEKQYEKYPKIMHLIGDIGIEII